MSQALLPWTPGRQQTLTRYRAAGVSRFITLCFIVLLDVVTISQIKGLAILRVPFSHVTLLRRILVTSTISETFSPLYVFQ